MAATQGSLALASIALAAATAKTGMQLTAPSNIRVKIKAWGVFFDGTSTTAQPVQVRLLRQTSAGTGTSQNPVLIEKSLSETLQTAGGVNYSAEPTAGDVLAVKTVHPQAGYEYPYPFGDEDIIQGGGRIGIELNAPAIVNVRGYIRFEE